MDVYPEVIGDLYDAALLRGMTDETKIIGVSDGGIGLSEELKRQFPTIQFILDKTHLKDHLYETAEALEIDKKERVKWVEHRIKTISNGEVEVVINEFEEQYKQDKIPRVKSLIGYLTRFLDALDYNRFKEKGYPIGSGEIESAHKSIPQKRLKIPGASWLLESINPMLALRILRANIGGKSFGKNELKNCLQRNFTNSVDLHPLI